ncbi:hypothetical protein VTN31DRAFT_149 [Thermomyces dupontii]|uniref:uncharacterized protein n=1 Tax=Talaromyces thermophilus TaxID=28565 RepID=UPI0037426F28
MTSTEVNSVQPAVDPEKDATVGADPKIVKHSHDADEALKAVLEAGGQAITIDDETNRRLLRTIDWHMMPLMCVVYMMNYLDKTTLSYASVMGLKEDLHLVGDNYQWLGSLFYFGYLAWEYPTGQLLQRMPLGKYSAVWIILWGAVLSCFAAVHNFSGAVAIRFMLGVSEAAVTPGFALLTSQWWTKREQGSRTNIWFSFNGTAQIVGGLVAYGIAVGSRKHGSLIEPWKVVFLANGLFTIALGVLFFFYIPDNQLNARWLSKEDRIKAVERVRVNQQGIGNKSFKWYQFKEAFTDPITWAFVGYSVFSQIPNGGISNFFSQLIVGFGYTAEQSLLYGTPGGAVQIVALILSGYLGDYYGQRLLFSSGGVIAALVGMILIIALPVDNHVGRLIGYYLFPACATSFVALLSMISTNVAGYTKKTTVAALYLISYCVGNLIGPHTFRPKDAPRYVPAVIVIVVCFGVCLADLALIWWWYRRENRRKARIRAQPGYVKLENQEFLDLTDRENHEFEYAL